MDKVSYALGMSIANNVLASGVKNLNLEEFAKALKEKGPVWIECAIAAEERVLPMIPGGGTVEDMIIG